MQLDQSQLDAKLVDYIQDAYAMESDVLVMLQSMIRTTTDEDIKAHLDAHLEETRNHQRLMKQCLKRHGQSPSTRKEAQTLMAGMAKGAVDVVRGDKAGKNARDGFITEHMEIAAYELLERLAKLAGDTETVEAARTIKAEEIAMAQIIDDNWDRFLELTLQEAGIAIPQAAAS